MAQLWRILLHQIEVQPVAAIDIVKTLTDLHNFVKIEEPKRSFTNSDTPADHCPTTSTQTLNSVESPRYRASKKAIEVRETFMNYFLSDQGAVLWQSEKVFSKP